MRHQGVFSALAFSPSARWLASGGYDAYLQHNTGLSVLLNRPGRNGTRPLGYSDSQAFRVSLRDHAASGDPRPLLLGQFTSLDSAGTWTLFLADLSSVGRVGGRDPGPPGVAERKR